jgi:nucleoside-diphosphate-sugar epimerase
MARLALVTGATGFVGRHLVDQLTSDGWTVRALVRATSDVRHLVEKDVELCTGDLTDAESLRESTEGVDTVFHLAAVVAARTEEEYRRANAGGTRGVVSAVRAAGGVRRLIYLSSYAAAGPSTGDRPRQVSDTPEPLTAYGRTKLEGERIAKDAESAGTEVVVLRSPVVYGPGDRALLSYFQLVRWNVALMPGGSDRRLHLIFAPDLGVALRRAAHAPPGTFSVADPTPHLWSEIVSSIALALGRRPLRIPLPAALVRAAAAGTEGIGRLAGRAVPFNREKAEEMLAPAWTADLSGSEELLSPEQVTPLSDAMERTVRWYIRQGWL